MKETRNRLFEQYLESTKRLNRALWACQHAAWKKMRIHPAQAFAMYFLYRHQAVNVAMMAKMMGSTSSAATQLISGLVKKGLIKRHHSGRDRRLVEIKITSRGSKILKKFRAEHERWLKSYLSDLSDQDLNILIKLQNKVLKDQDYSFEHGHHHC